MIYIDTDRNRLEALVADAQHWHVGPTVRTVLSAGFLGQAVLNEIAHVYGLVHRGKAQGAATMIPLTNPDVVMHRHELYALAPMDDAVSAWRLMITAIADAHGPGDWWTVGDPIEYAVDDGLVPCGDINGVRHVLLRSIYFHAPAAVTGSTGHVSSTADGNGSLHAVVHLEREQHDVGAETISVWCTWPERWERDEATRDIAQATCLSCLDRAREYGRRAEERQRELAGKTSEIPT